jgi:hypothetical protein
MEATQMFLARHVRMHTRVDGLTEGLTDEQVRGHVHPAANPLAWLLWHMIRWQRTAFQLVWAWKSRRNGPGRPAVAPEVRALIRHMSRANPLWGAPRIHGELQKLGLEISQAAVSKYLDHRSTPPSQTWRTFLDNHHVVVLNETHLRRLLREYLLYDHGARTHLSLAKDAPEPRPVERLDEGRIVETPMVGGLHHRYTRRAA